MNSCYEALSELGKVFGHRTRLRILEILASNEACVCHLTAILGEAQAHVSQQLRILRDNGLVMDRRDGVMIYYRLADARAMAIVSLLKELQRLQAPETVYPSVPVSPVEGCPCPHCAGGQPYSLAKGCC